MIQIGSPIESDDFVWTKADGSWQSTLLDSKFKDATSAAFIPGSADILLGTINGRAVRVDVANNKAVREFTGAKKDRVFEKPVGALSGGSLVAVSSNGSLAASTWSKNGTHQIDIWDLETGESLSKISAVDGALALAFHPNDRILAFTDYTGAVKCIDLSAPERPNETFKRQGPQFATGLVFSADGKHLIQSGEYLNKRLISVWEVRTGMEVNPRIGKGQDSREITSQNDYLFEIEPSISANGNAKAEVADVAVSPDGKWFATAAIDGYIALWRIQRGRYSFIYKVPVNSLEIMIGDLGEQDAYGNPSLEHFGLRNIEFSSDSQTIYVADQFGTIHLLTVQDLVDLSVQTPQEKLTRLQQIYRLRVGRDGKAETFSIERNRMVPIGE